MDAKPLTPSQLARAQELFAKPEWDTVDRQDALSLFLPALASLDACRAENEILRRQLSAFNKL